MTNTHNNSAAPRQSGIWYTVLQTIGGKAQAKTIARVNGELRKTGESIPLTDGSYWGIEASDIDAFLDVIEQRHYGTDTTLCYGLGPIQSGIIATAKAIKSGKAQPGAISRSASSFTFRDGYPAVMMLDGDPTANTGQWSPSDHDAALCEVFGILGNVARGILPSSGSGIYDAVTHLRLDKSNGFRIYFAVDNGPDIPAIGNAMFAALVEAGYGYVAFAKNGRRMLRTFLDAAVWQGERVDFAFGSVLGEGLTQWRPMTRLGELPMLRSADTPKIPDLAAWIKQSREAQELLKKAEPEAKAIRARWVAEREETNVKALVFRGWTPEKARTDVRAAINRAETGGFEIRTQHDLMFLNDGSQLTVREVLSNPDRYHELALRDPDEPEAGMSKAILYLKNQREFPVLYSQLHGGCVDRLVDIDALFPDVPMQLPPGAVPFVPPLAMPQAAQQVPPPPPRPGLAIAGSRPTVVQAHWTAPSAALGGTAPGLPVLPGFHPPAAATALAVAYSPLAYAPPAPAQAPADARSSAALMNELPERLKTSIDKAEATDLGFIVRQLMQRQFAAAEVLTALEGTMAAHLGVDLAPFIAREASEFERREAQRKLNFEIGNDTGLARDRPNTPFVNLAQMLKNFVYIRKGPLVADLDGFRVMSLGEKVNDLAASKTMVKVGSKGIETKEYPTLQLWLAHLDRTAVDVPTWAPGRPLFCHAPDAAMGMDKALNIWRGLPAYTPPPDWEQRAAIFDRHIEYLVPIAAERHRFMQWLAHIVQKPGELPHTAYVMIALATGIGRNWLASVLVRVLRGYVATGLDLNRILDSDFNGPLGQKLLVTIDEAHEGMDGYKRYERSNTLKRIITEECRLINPKHERPHTEYNAARWLMFSNFEDPLPIDEQDRRIVYIENPKVRQSPEYYTQLYAALKMPGFIDSVRHRLQKLDLTGFNLGASAEMNAIKRRSLDAMKTDVDHALDSFKENWPGDFVLNKTVREYVQNAVSGPINNNHLTNAMRRAGFTAYNKQIKYDGKPERISIVRNTTVQTLDASNPSVLGDYCRKWLVAFKFSGN